MTFDTQTSELPAWKAGIVAWIDKNYGAPEQLQALGLQKRAWYQFNFVEIGVTAALAYFIVMPVLRFSGFL